jgi:TRAP-type uncharacterized transport system fused permease subunit
LALAGFLVPYAFVYNNGLLATGPLLEIIWVTTTATIGVVLLASAIIGYFLTFPTRVERVLLFAASLLLIHPEKTTDFVGLGLGLLVFVLQKRRKPQAAPVPHDDLPH